MKKIMGKDAHGTVRKGSIFKLLSAAVLSCALVGSMGVFTAPAFARESGSATQTAVTAQQVRKEQKKQEKREKQERKKARKREKETRKERKAQEKKERKAQRRERKEEQKAARWAKTHSLPQKAQPVTWNYGNQAIKDSENSLQDSQVRQSPFYSTTVHNTGSSQLHESFTYLSIPRGGLGKQGYTGDDGADFAYDNGFTMSWSSFVYSHDVWVNVSLNTGARISSADDVTIRPSSLKFDKKMVDDHTIAIKVPFKMSGYRFSVEFKSEQTTVYANGATDAVTQYNATADKERKLRDGKEEIETEPRNSMMVFAQPEVKDTVEGKNTIPTRNDGKIFYVEPGEFPQSIPNDYDIVYIKAGVHWMGSKRQMELGGKTRWVYFEPGAFVKGAFYFTGSPEVTNYKMTGYGVLSTEQYGYETSTKNNFQHRPDSDSNCWDSCVKPMRFTSDAQQQTLDIQGITVKEPSYHSFVMYAYEPPKKEDSDETPQFDENGREKGSEDTFSLNVRNYQQVGAWYWQTDGLELYKGSTMRDVFIHANDDVVKLYHPDVSVKNTVVWKNENGPVFQWGWVGRNIDNVTVENTDIIHSRMYWGGNDNMCVFNSAGDLWNGSHEESPSPQWMVQNMTIRNTRVEGNVNCGIRITSLGSMRNVNIDGFYVESWTKQRSDLQRSTFTVARSHDGKYGNIGDEGKANGLNIHNYYVGDTPIGFSSENWQADQRGKLDFDESLNGKWSLTYDGEATGVKPTIDVDDFASGQVVDSRDIALQGRVTGAASVDVLLGAQRLSAPVTNGRFSLPIHLDEVLNVIRLEATGATGVKSAKYLSLTAYGSALGSLDDPTGDDNGPGSYVYPTNSSFAPGNFDLTKFGVYDDGDNYNFVADLASNVHNPWGGNGISTQQLHVYLRDGAASDSDVVPLRKGTQTYAKGQWKYVVVADGRYEHGVFDADGNALTDSSNDIAITAVGKSIIVSVPKSSLQDIDIAQAQYEVSLYSSSESSEGVGNVRPVYSQQCWAGEAEGCNQSWIKEFRFGGAKGNYIGTSPYNSDTTASNAIDIITGDEHVNGSQSDIMSLTKDRIIVPYVELKK